MEKIIRFAYTPDPDDSFHYYALENKKIEMPEGISTHFQKGHIQDLNELTLKGELEVSAISSAFYPFIDKEYVILASGASVGRNYGPLLGIKKGSGIKSLEGKRVAIPGAYTTGYFLLQYFFKDFEPVSMPFNAVGDAIEQGIVDAGVMIHEDLLNYKYRNIEKLCCLGEKWFEATELPIPVGLNVAKRSLGLELLIEIQEMVHESMVYALEHRPEALVFASRSGRGPESPVRDEFVEKFANQDTLCMPTDVRWGLYEVFRRAYERNIIDHVPTLDIVDSVKKMELVS